MVIGTQGKVYFCVQPGSHLDLSCDANFSSNIMHELNEILIMSIGIGELFLVYLRNSFSWLYQPRFKICVFEEL